MSRGDPLKKVSPVAFCVLLLALVFAGGAAPSNPVPPAPDEATTSQLDAAHDAAIADAGLTAPLSQAWSVSMPGASYPLIADGMVFVVSTQNNTLNALDQATGATIWSHPVGQPAELAYDRGRVFMVNKAGLLNAFDAATGVITWTVQLTGESVFGSVAVANGIVYVVGTSSFNDPTYNATLYAVRESDSRVLWTNSSVRPFGPPSVTAQGVYASTETLHLQSGGGYLGCKDAYDLDPQSGATLWHSMECVTEAFSSPVVASGHVVVGDMLFSPSTGAVQGRITGGPFVGTPFFMYPPAVANDVLFAVTEDGTLNAAAGTGLGAVKWKFTVPSGTLSTAPIVAGGLVFVGKNNQDYPVESGTLYAVDAATGVNSWSATLGFIPESLAASNGTLVVSGRDKIAAYRNAGAITSAPANQSLPSVEGSADLNEIKSADVGVWSGLPSAYTYQWELCDSAGANCADIAGATAASYLPGAEAYGKTLRVKVAGTNDNGSSDPVESAASAVLGVASAAPVLSTPPNVTGTGVAGDQLATTNGTWTNSATSYAYKWQRCSGGSCVDIAGATSAQYTPDFGDIGAWIRSAVRAINAVGPASSGYAVSSPVRITRVAKSRPDDQATSFQLDVTHDGSMPDANLAGPLTEAWSLNLPAALSSSLIADGMVFVTAGKTIYALNQATGATIWSHPLGGGATAAYDRGRVFVTSGSYWTGLLTAYDATTGAIDWTEKPPGHTTFGVSPVASDGILYTGGLNPGKSIYAVRESDGTVLWQQSVDPDASGGFPAVTPQGVYLYGMSAFDPLLGTPLWHQPLGTGGPVVAGGQLLAGNVSLSPSNGDVLGPVTAPGVPHGYPAVANGVAFVVSDQSSPSQTTTLSAVSDSGLGATNWTFGGDDQISTPPIVVGGRVFVGSGHDKLFAVDAATGATSWSANVSYLPESLAAANGTLVVGSENQLVAYRSAGTITDAPANQTPPTVDGGFDLNETAAADVGVWSGLPSSYAYQWELCDGAGGNCADIPGATGASYVPRAEAYGQTLRVRVTATNDVGSSDSVESAATEMLGLAMAPPAFSTAPVVDGTPAVGQQLSTTNGTWTNSATSYVYQWQRCDDTGSNCVNIAGATGSHYTPVEADIGFELRSEVRASNSVGPAPSGYAPSDPTSIVVAPGAPTISTPPADQAVASQIDATHDGFVPDAGLAPPFTKAWTTSFASPVSDPLIVNGIVYFTSQNVLYAVRQSTGETVWTQSVGSSSNSNGWSGGPAYDRGRIFVVQPKEFGPNYARGRLDAFDAVTGAPAWSIVPFPDIDVDIGGQPVATNGIVYAQSGPAGTVAVRESDGQVIWPLLTSPDSTPPSGTGGSDAAVTADGVYVSNHAQQVWKLDPQLPQILWHRGVGDGSGLLGPAPVVAGGHVYTLDHNGQNLILSAATGALQGSFNADAGNAAYGPPPAVANGVAFTLDGSTLSAVDGDGLGNILWNFTGDGTLSSPPIVAGGLVFVASSQGNLYALDATTGATTWSTNVGVQVAHNYDPPPTLAAANGTVVVSIAGKVIAYRNAGAIADAPSNESTPSVQGPADLSGLEAVDVGVWSGLPSAYSYQWELCDSAGSNCTDIAGATGASYLPPPLDVGTGKTLRVRVVATNDIGASAPVESAPSASVPLVVTTQPPSSRRNAERRNSAPSTGDLISTTNGIWTHDPTSYTYKWQRCDTNGRHCIDIAGATSPHYTPVAADRGHELRSEVRARNASGPAVGYVPSTPTGPVGLPWPGLLAPPKVTGNAVVSQLLSTNSGSWSHSPTSYKYQWRRCDTKGSSCVTIPNATTRSYRLVAADAGHAIRSAVLAGNAFGPAASGYALSVPTKVVVGKPAVVAVPKISGLPKVGHPLSVSTGTWRGYPTTYAYQWLRCTSTGTLCKAIAGATSTSYLLTSADSGHKVKATVKASNAAGSTSATSAASAKVAK